MEKVFRVIDKDSDGIITPLQAMDLLTTITYSSGYDIIFFGEFKSIIKYKIEIIFF